MQPAPLAAEEAARGRRVSEGGTYSFTFENDLFAGEDNNYTNGVRFDHVSQRNDLPAWARFARKNSAG